MKEKQSFHAFVIALVVFIVVLVNFFLVYQTSANPWIVLGIMILNSSMALAFLFAKLVTHYDNEKLTCRFYPFLWKEKKFYWSEVDRAWVRKYSPLREYGGWGIRFGRRKYGKAYNTKGNMGLQLIFKSGEKLLIGTQEPEALQSFLDNLYNKNIVKPENG